MVWTAKALTSRRRMSLSLNADDSLTKESGKTAQHSIAKEHGLSV